MTTLTDMSALMIALLPLYFLAIHNALMVHLLAADNDRVNPILPDGGKR